MSRAWLRSPPGQWVLSIAMGSVPVWDCRRNINVRKTVPPGSKNTYLRTIVSKDPA